VRIASREVGDLIMLGIGGFTPLDGFMTRADWQGVCDGMKMRMVCSGRFLSPLSTDEVTAQSINTGAEIALVDAETDEVMATRRSPKSTRSTRPTSA